MTLFEKNVSKTHFNRRNCEACRGVEVLRRYIVSFSTKIELVIETAGHYWEQVAGKYLTELERAESVSLKKWSGYQRLEQILHIFCRILKKRKHFLKFLQEFDVFEKNMRFPKKVCLITKMAF